MLGRAFGALVDGLLPPRCHHCASPVLRNAWSPFLCTRCAAALRPCYQRLDLGVGHPGRGLLLYTGPCRSLVRALKFQGCVSIGRRFGHAMVPLLESVPPGTLAVVPMPLHWRRQWIRGHNQARAIAGALALARPGAQLCPLLCRMRPTAPQVGRGAAARERNMRNAFALAHRYRGGGCPPRVVLVDDVITTGATMRAAVRCLRAGGARHVWACAAAVTPPSSPTSTLEGDRWRRRDARRCDPVASASADALASSRAALWPVARTTSR